MSTRQSGRTVEQMRNAPHGAVYVWPNDQLDYPRRLLQFVSRTDLEIVPKSALTEGRLRGKRVVVDHAVRLDLDELQHLKELIR